MKKSFFPTMILLVCVDAFSVVYTSRLSSMLTNPFKEKLDTLIEGRKTLCLIPTASFAYSPDSNRSKGEQRRRARYDAKNRAQELAERLGLLDDTPVVLELDRVETLEDPENVITEALNNSAVCIVDGGNTFYLQKCMLDCDFWTHATPCFSNRPGQQGTVYVGASAGSIVASNSIKTAYFKGWDDPAAAGADFVWNDDSYRGSNLAGRIQGVDVNCDVIAANSDIFRTGLIFSVFPHYLPELHDTLLEQVPEWQFTGGRVVCLGDEECVIVSDSARMSEDGPVVPYVFTAQGETVPLRGVITK